VNPRNKIFILFGVIIVAATAYYFFSTDRTQDTVLIGTVDANQVIVSPQMQGRIQRLLVDEGTVVKAGDLIAMLDPSELEAQKRAAEATLASLQSQVAASRSNETMMRGSTTSDVANAEARLQSTHSQLAEAQATLEQTKLDTQRTVSLNDQGIASQQDRDRALATLKSQQAHVKSLQDMVKSAEQDLNSAKAKTNQASAAESTTAATRSQMINTQALLAQAETRLGYTKVYAPVAGTVSVRAAREGEVVNPGQAIVTIVDYNDTWVYAAIPETYAARVPMGDKLKVRLPGGEMMQGEVIFKAPEGDYATQRDVSRRKRDIKTVGMKVRVDNSKRTLVPGMTAEVLLPKAIVDLSERAVQNAEKQ
jgi:multidrug resistance efflux pump